MRKREGEKARGEILNEDGKEMGWMKWYNLPTKGSFTSSRPLVQEIFFLNCYFYKTTVIRNPIGQRKHY
jgi:hypothetical protein